MAIGFVRVASAVAVLVAAVGVGEAAVPGWVQVHERPAAAEAVARVQLHDDQVRFEGGVRTHFQRQVAILQPEDLGDDGRFTLVLSGPGRLHYAEARRDGKVVARVEGRMIDAAHDRVVLAGVEAGDQIDSAYSSIARVERIVGALSVSGFDALDRRTMRLIVPAAANVQVKVHGPGAEPVVETNKKWRTYTWDLANSPFIPLDESTAGWYQQSPIVQYTDMQSWEELGDWMAPRFAVPDAPTPAVAARAKAIASAHDDPRARAVAAVRFVQHEIGNEARTGPRPDELPIATPDEVLASASGDSHGKARLLVALLRALGARADVALASHLNRGTVGFWLAGPIAFDAVVVRYRIGTDEHWVDPLDAYARGTTPHRLMVERALLLEQPAASMWDVPAPQFEDPAFETLRLYRMEGSARARIDVTFTTRGGYASWARGRNPQAIEDERTEYLRSDGLPVTVDKGIELHDDDTRNERRYTARYALPTPWAAGALTVGTSGISNALYAPDLTRTTPLGVLHPVHMRDRARVEVPAGFALRSQRKTFANRFFSFEFSAQQDGKRAIVLEWTYRTKVGHVMPEDLAEYAAEVERALDFTAYEMRWTPPTDEDEDGSSWRWWELALAAGTVALGLWLRRVLS